MSEEKSLPQKKDEEKNYFDKIHKKIRALPLKEKLKAIALMNLFIERKKLDEELEKEINDITLKYEKLSQPIYEKANAIIQGVAYPNEEELKGYEQFLTSEEKPDKDDALEASVIPSYWEKVFKNCDIISHEIKEKDFGAFQHITRVDCQKHENDLDFTINFHFDETNPYFKPSVLSKTFFMHDDVTPLKTKSTVIEWKKNMDLTKKTVQRKQKNKRTGHTKIVEKEIFDDSFFLFFQNWDEEQHSEEEIAERMNIDYDIARILIDDAIPYSLEYYLNINENAEEIHENDIEIMELDSKPDAKKKDNKKKKTKNLNIKIETPKNEPTPKT